jgi:hypothetical protein
MGIAARLEEGAEQTVHDAAQASHSTADLLGKIMGNPPEEMLAASKQSVARPKHRRSETAMELNLKTEVSGPRCPPVSLHE